jgi:hypothetical protein
MISTGLIYLTDSPHPAKHRKNADTNFAKHSYIGEEKTTNFSSDILETAIAASSCPIALEKETALPFQTPSMYQPLHEPAMYT